MKTFIDFIREYITLSDAAANDIVGLMMVEEVDKGHFLSVEGKTCKRLYFIADGTVRAYFFKKGKDITHWVYPSNSMVTSWHSYLLGVPSAEYVETTEKSTIVSLTYSEWEGLYAKHPELERFGRLISETQIATLDNFYKGYYFLTAKEKYELLISNYPSVIQRANLGHIASMLGISQETLSRIRGK